MFSSIYSKYKTSISFWVAPPFCSNIILQLPHFLYIFRKIFVVLLVCILLLLFSFLLPANADSFKLNFISYCIKIEIPIFYFTYENMDFLMNFLLPNGIQINHLIFFSKDDDVIQKVKSYMDACEKAGAENIKTL